MGYRFYQKSLLWRISVCKFLARCVINISLVIRWDGSNTWGVICVLRIGEKAIFVIGSKIPRATFVAISDAYDLP